MNISKSWVEHNNLVSITINKQSNIFVVKVQEYYNPKRRFFFTNHYLSDKSTLKNLIIAQLTARKTANNQKKLALSITNELINLFNN